MGDRNISDPLCSGSRQWRDIVMQDASKLDEWLHALRHNTTTVGTSSLIPRGSLCFPVTRLSNEKTFFLRES